MSRSVMLDVEGIELTPEDKELLLHPGVGGLILFTRNFQSRHQLRELIADIRSVNPEILIAVDQEGGRVQRFRDGFEPLPALQKIGDLSRLRPNEMEQICFSLGWLMAVDVLETGIDISFAPVLDLDRNGCPAIADRSFSADAEETSVMARAYIAGMREAGMASTAKHFPGHGSVLIDSHVGLPVDDRNLELVRKRDMRPFTKLCEEFDAVMPGHILFPQIDSQPVGFSRIWLQEILRGELGFQGMIFSDDLSMGGAAESGSYQDRAGLALEAGCDMLLACNNQQGALEILEYVENLELEDRWQKIALMKARKTWSLDSVKATDYYADAQRYMTMIKELN